MKGGIMMSRRQIIVFGLILSGLGLVLGVVALLGMDVAAQPADTTILQMHFDGDVNDSSGNSLHGAWVGMASYTAGISGTALDLSGTNYVYTDHNDLLGGMGQVTVDVWARKNDPDSGGQVVLKHLHYAIIVGAEDVTSYVGNAEGTLGRANVYSLDAIHDTDWHHYVLAYNGSVVRLFVDDVLVADAPLTGTVRSDSGYDFYVGWSPWPTPGVGFEGQIDELVIYEGAPDIDPPYFDGHDPAPGESWVEPDADIRLHVKDDGKGVLQSTIAMTVEGSLVPLTITGDLSDYAVIYDPPSDFAYDQEVNVTVEATDVDSNTVKQDYAFTIRSVADTIPPRGYFYVEDTGTVNVVIHSVIWDDESGMGPGAQMRLSNDGANWSTQPYTDTADWTLASTSGVRTVYAQYADVDGNWTEVKTYTLGGEPGGELVVTPYGPSAARLQWQTVPGVAEYVILRGNTLGWMGTLDLQGDLTGGVSTEVTVDSTTGLQPGCEVHFSGHGGDYYVDEVIDTTHFSLTNPVQRDYGVGTAVNLSGCWVKDYSGYAEIDWVSGANEYIDTGLSQETDYYYVIGYDYGSGITSYSIPVNGKLVQTGMVYDAALGASGGYAWKVTQAYGDTPELIDGDDATDSLLIQYNNPSIVISSTAYLHWGFHRFNLNAAMDVKRVEISQSEDGDHVEASIIRIGFDDRSTVEVDLLNDPLVTRVNQGNYVLYQIPVSKTTSYVNVYVESITNSSAVRYTMWNKVGVYTDRPIADPVTSAVDVSAVDIAIDFSAPDGTLPTTFGTDEVYLNTDGYEAGWMLRGWQYTKAMFNIYRIQTGDYWPHGYGSDLIQIGVLAVDITPGATTFPLQDINPYAYQINADPTRVKIGYELMLFDGMSGSDLQVTNRGYEASQAVAHPAGAPVFIYKNAGQILRLQEVLPEYPVEKIVDAYGSGISPIDRDVPFNDSSRYAILENVHMVTGTFAVSDVIRVGRELFLVLDVTEPPGDQYLRLQRGYDGTNQRFIQHNYPVRDVYKILNYEPYYEGFKNEPTDYGNYCWDNFKTIMDKVIKDGDAVPWLIWWGPHYATEARGRIAAIETFTSTMVPTAANNVIVDEYNSAHDDADWWYLIYDDPDDGDTRGDTYEFHHWELHILTGDAAGKVFYVRSHSEDRIRVVRTWDDSLWTDPDPEYVDLVAEGVKPGDVYKIVTTSYGNVSPKYWQYNADFASNVARYIRENYATELGDRPIFIEYYNEPNLGTYGTWTVDAYIDSYNLLAEAVRDGFGPDEVLVGAGSIAGGLNPGNKIPGVSGDYAFARRLVDECDVLDFVSHHRYYMGSRVQKRENSWEYWWLRAYAQSKGKSILIIDSEDSVATAGGTGNEQARHWAQFGATYWEANFINSYYGEYGDSGRVDFILHFRHFVAAEDGLGMVVPDSETGEPLFDLVYWPIEMYQDHTSTDRHNPDTMVRVIKGWDNYGWVQAMGTVHGGTGEKYVHLVNKKGTPIVVDLSVLGAGDVVSGTMTSVIGGGPNQTLGDGYHPLDYSGYNGQGPVVQTWIVNFDAIVLEPYSANIILLSTEEPHRIYLSLVLRAHSSQPDLKALPTPVRFVVSRREDEDGRE
ncbi:MAG: LamG domain-containing protein [Anaerolineae bacterium]|nr:LamG domain-containing protein [Anaerolineae bacterium]